MPGKINVYNWGQLGVDLVKSPLHLQDGAWTSLQNGEFPPVEGQGGIKKRGSLRNLNSTALAGPVQALALAPFAFPTGTQGLMVALNQTETNGWNVSTDGAAYTGLTTATIQRFASLNKLPPTVDASFISPGQRASRYKRSMYYPGDNYTQATSAPNWMYYDGVSNIEVLRIPTNAKSAGLVPFWIADTWAANNLIYLAIYDPWDPVVDAGATMHRGRILQFDPTTGVVTQVGNAFGPTPDNEMGFPFCLTSYLGYLWAGTYNINNNPTTQGGMYRLQPGVDTVWTLDHSPGAGEGYYMAACQYKGNLYAALDSSGASIEAKIEKRTAAGVWTDSLTGPDVGSQAYFGNMLEFDDLLFASYYRAGNKSRIYSFDGTTWAIDKNVGVDFAIKALGAPFIFRSNLYWPALSDDSGLTINAGFLLKRTTAGVWSKVLDTFGPRGALTQYTPTPT